MSRNVIVGIISENDDTTRDGVPDWLIHFHVSWTDNDGVQHERTEDEYFLLLCNWLRQNHPAAAKRWMEQVAFQIARVKYGIDDAETLG